MNDSQIATPEYIHLVVANFIDDWINRRIYFSDFTHRAHPEIIMDVFSKFGSLVKDHYFDVKIIGTQRAEIERALFDYIVSFTTTNLVIPSKNNPSAVELKIDRLERGMESTNHLLTKVLQSLQELKDKTEKPKRNG